ncbi:MAG TPA: cation:proton antiporter [Trueperaceae bacterium]
MSPLLQLGLIALGLYLAGWVSTKLGLSSIVGFMVLGVALGPHGFYPLYQVTPVTEMLGELGIVLLLFFMGLEFSLGRFTEGGRNILVAGSIDLLGFVAGATIGLLLDFGVLASLFLGGIVYVSSSGVIAKLLSDEDLIAYPEAERTLGVLVYEDLAMIVVLGGLAFMTSGGGTARFLGVALFLLAYAILLRFGRKVLERLLGREGEDLVLLLLALVVLFSVGAQGLNFPEAVAAFLLGMLIAESKYKDRVEVTLHSWRDVAAAVFFLDFGLHVEMQPALARWQPALVLVLVTVVVQVSTGYLAGRATGISRRGSVGHGLMLLPRGEFSLLVVGLVAGVDSIPVEVREALMGMTSLYVLAMVVVGSAVFRNYEVISNWLQVRLRTPEARRAVLERQRELERMTLD